MTLCRPAAPAIPALIDDRTVTSHWTLTAFKGFPGFGNASSYAARVSSESQSPGPEP